MTANINPDLLYLLPRESLLLFEDARFFGLVSDVANYYLPRNDQPSWGVLLRGVAQEMSKLDYDYQYDIVARQPQYLTPPDIRRRWAGPAHVGRNFPPPTQFDKGDFTTSPINPPLTNPVGYRDMIVDLLAAYGLGATVESIQQVIYAYTGKTIKVVELYTLIGQGVYDQSDRNAIQVTVNAFGSNPLTQVQSLGQLQEIVQNLYGAIDLAKPAHVGLEFTTVFSEAEQIALHIIDTLRIIIPQVENPPLDPMLWIAPIFNVKHPKTTISSWGTYLPKSISSAQWSALQALPPVWLSGTAYVRGALVTGPANGWQQYRAKKGSTNQNPTTSPAYWTLVQSPATWQGYYSAVPGTYILGITQYGPGTPYYTGQFVIDPNGNLEIATIGGTSGASVTFNPEKGGITNDNGIVWLNVGLSYLTDPNKWIQVLDAAKNPTGEIANWNVAMPMGLVAPREKTSWEVKSDTFAAYNMD